MKIGDIVEALIYYRDKVRGTLDRETDDAICAACNILDRLPCDKTEYEVRDMLRRMTDAHADGSADGRTM